IVELPGVEREHRALRVLDYRDLARPDRHWPRELRAAQLLDLRDRRLGVVGPEVNQPIRRLLRHLRPDAAVAAAVGRLDHQVWERAALQRVGRPPEQVAVEAL